MILNINLETSSSRGSPALLDPSQIGREISRMTRGEPASRGPCLNCGNRPTSPDMMEGCGITVNQVEGEEGRVRPSSCGGRGRQEASGHRVEQGLVLRMSHGRAGWAGRGRAGSW